MESKKLETIQSLFERVKLGDYEVIEEILTLLPPNITGGEPPMLVLHKLNVAKRQLETAIALIFEDADPVSIHTLACAAHCVLRGLNDHAGGPPTITSASKHKNVRDFHALINAPGNFFKHAEYDADDFLRFRPQVSWLWIFDACLKYRDLTGEVVPLFPVFEQWFILSFPEACSKSVVDSVKPELKDLFLKNDRKGFLKFYNDPAPVFIQVTGPLCSKNSDVR